MKQVTESFYQYNNYTIRLRFVKGRFEGAAQYAIIKYTSNKSSPNGIKAMYLKRENWNYQTPEILLSRAKNYIDNHKQNLNIQESKILSKYSSESI